MHAGVNLEKTSSENEALQMLQNELDKNKDSLLMPMAGHRRIGEHCQVKKHWIV